MELDFGQESYGTHFDSFMRHYLTVKTGSIPRLGDTYDAFKIYSRSDNVKSAGVEALVEDIQRFSRYYCTMALGVEKDKKLSIAFHDLRELKVEVADPFLLELYHDYSFDMLSREDFLAMEHEILTVLYPYRISRMTLILTGPYRFKKWIGNFMRSTD